MSEHAAGRQLWAALHAHVRAQDVAYWWPARWESLPEWLQAELEVVATHGAAEQAGGERREAEEGEEGAQGPAALALLRMMEQISEEHWAAGWYSGLERILWQQVTAPAFSEAVRPVLSAKETVVLRWLAEQAGGWWTWPKGTSEPVFVRMQEWQRLYGEQSTGGRGQSSAGREVATGEERAP